jgi:peptidoglycan/LPS O-acetylase OafA/YrhL
VKASERIPIIDMLRGLSCIGVLLYHLRVDLWIGWWRIRSYPEEYSSFAKAVAWLSIPTPFMGYAVLLFFLISGFCIHYPNTISNAQPNWKDYLIRRFWRIYPSYFAALIITACISYFCYIIWEDNNWDLDRILRVATLSQNYPPRNGQFLSNPSLWTIPLEVEFYILYPLVFYLIAKSRIKTLVFIATVMCSSSVVLNIQGISWPSFTSLFLWPSWLLGVWIAQWERKKQLTKLNTKIMVLPTGFSLLLALFSILESWVFWLQYLAWTVFYFLLFILCLNNTNLFIHSISKRFYKFISWIGKMSFSLYLIHFPVFKLFGHLHTEIWNEKPANFLISLAYLLPTGFLGWLFFIWVEEPIHRWSRQRFATR